MTDDIDYWLPPWWDVPVSDSGPSAPSPVPAVATTPVQIAGVQTQLPDQGVAPDPPGSGRGPGGPPPAAGAAVAVDEETVAELRRIKRVTERNKRMIGR